MSEHQASRKQHIPNHYGEQEYQDDVDVILDLYNQGRANLDQVAAAINDLKHHRDRQFNIPQHAVPGVNVVANHEWATKPYDHEEDGI